MNDPIESRFADIENAVALLANKMGQLSDRVESDKAAEKNTSVMNDDLWVCRSCNARLGVYNKDRNELRVRYKDFSVYIVSGKGGKVSVPCRRCAEINTVEDP